MRHLEQTHQHAELVTPRQASVTIAAGHRQTQVFSATVPGGGGTAWAVDGVTGGNAGSGTIVNGLYTPPAAPGTHTVTATSIANPSLSATASVAVTDLAGVTTYHNDLARTGVNAQEYALTPAIAPRLTEFEAFINDRMAAVAGK